MIEFHLPPSLFNFLHQFYLFIYKVYNPYGLYSNNTEGGRRLENVDKDLVHLWKKIKWAVRKSENVVIGLIAELEIKVDKLALKLVKKEAPPNPGSSSSFDAKNN